MKLLAKIIIIIAVFSVGFYSGRHYAVAPADSLHNSASSTPAADEKKDSPRLNQADIKINFSDNETKEFNGIEIKENETVFNALKKITEANSIDLKYKDYGGDMGVLIESIGGIANDFNANKYWQFWVNGEYSNIGASGYKLKNGDSVEWKYAGYAN